MIVEDERDGYNTQFDVSEFLQVEGNQTPQVDLSYSTALTIGDALIDLTGTRGPLTVGLPLNAIVRDAFRGHDWWISSSRSRNSSIVLLKNALPPTDNMIECQHDDVYKWKPNHHTPSNNFSASKTWTALNPSGDRVPWHSSVWFKDRIPKHAFICWVVAWNRLHTRDRLISWGLNIPSVCVLCNVLDESHNHLFFQCQFNEEIWSFFTIRPGMTPPNHFHSILLWLKSASTSKNLSLIIKLIFQACVYLIWRERNSRIHSNNSRTPSHLLKEIQQTIRAWLDPICRDRPSGPLRTSLLATWFELFQV
ncbi:putative reverse transcriptase zinc-binding domain-containing protein [Arabidopsis thaliana]